MLTYCILLALHSMAGTFGFDAITNMPTFSLEIGRMAYSQLEAKG